MRLGEEGAALRDPRCIAYAGLAPVTRRSGSSIAGEHPARGGNKRLKNALFLSAFTALHDPESRAYYDRKRSQGKKLNAALVCLADAVSTSCSETAPTTRSEQPRRPDRPLRDTPLHGRNRCR